MSNTIPTDVIVGVDTHKDVHAVAAISALGVHPASTTFPASSKGRRAFEAWAASLGTVRAIGIEGAGSYGARLSRFLNERGHAVLEVNRANRQMRHQKGKSDAVDAESAARAVLAGQAAGQPRSGTSTVEMIRHFKVARDTAVKGRSQAMQTLKAIIVNSPAALREQLGRVTGKVTLVRRLAAMRPGPVTSTMASAKTSPRAIARRWLALDAEIKEHDAQPGLLTAAKAPEPIKAHGMAAGTASIEAATGRPTPHSAASQSCVCAAASRRWTTFAGEQPRGRASRGSSAASSAAWRARSSDTSAAHRSPRPRRPKPLDRYRSINAMAETVNGLYKAEVIHRRGPWRSLEAVEFATLDSRSWSAWTWT